MGKKKLSWRDILFIVGTSLAVILPLIIAWDWTVKRVNEVLNYYKGQAYLIGAILKFLFLTTEGRQMVLSMLVIGLIIWLMLLNKRIGKLLPSKEEGTDGDVKSLRKDYGKHKEKFIEVTRELGGEIRNLRYDLSQIYDEAKKYKQIDIRPEYILILEALGASTNHVLNKGGLYGLYRSKHKFATNNEANLSFNLTIDWLEGNEYIKQSQTETDWNIHLVKITKKGFQYIRIAKTKKEEEKKKMKEEEKKPL